MSDLWLLSFMWLMSGPLSLYQLDCHYRWNQSKLKQDFSWRFPWRVGTYWVPLVLTTVFLLKFFPWFDYLLWTNQCLNFSLDGQEYSLSYYYFESKLKCLGSLAQVMFCVFVYFGRVVLPHTSSNSSTNLVHSWNWNVVHLLPWEIWPLH